jgi:hypothetical protein
MLRINVLHWPVPWELYIFYASLIQRRRDFGERRQKIYDEFTLWVKTPEMVDIVQFRKPFS